MDISRPHLIFAITWLLTFALAGLIETNFSVAFPLTIYAVVFGSIAIFYAAYGIMQLLLPKPARTTAFPRPNDIDLIILSAFNVRLFAIWAVGFAATIVYSGGIPIFWRLVGDPRNYIDFGMPTVSGLFNMFRCFIVAGTVALVVLGRAQRIDLVIGGICLASAFAEISRGSIVSVVLHGVAMIALFRPLHGRELVFGLLFLWISLITFEYIGNIRTIGYDANFGQVLGGTFEGDGYLSQYIWTFIYVTSPFNNLAYALSQNFVAPMVPYYTMQPLVPTALRNLLFTPGEYPIELLNEAFNATTAYAPMIADFGPWIAMAIFGLVALVMSFAYVAAKRGSLLGMLVYPPIFTSVTLSFFYAYFFALPIVLYPALAASYMLYRRTAIDRAQRLIGQALV